MLMLLIKKCNCLLLSLLYVSPVESIFLLTTIQAVKLNYAESLCALTPGLVNNTHMLKVSLKQVFLGGKFKCNSFRGGGFSHWCKGFISP